MALVACSMGLLPRPSLLKIFCVVLWWTNTKPLVEVTQIKWLATNTSPLCTWPMCETLITPSRWLNKEDFTPRFTPIGWFGGDWPPKWRIKANNVSVTKRKNMLLVSVEDSSLPKVCCSASCDRLMRQTPGVQFQVVWTCFEQHDIMSTTSQCSNQLSEHDSSSARYWNSLKLSCTLYIPGRSLRNRARCMPGISMTQQPPVPHIQLLARRQKLNHTSKLWIFGDSSGHC